MKLLEVTIVSCLENLNYYGPGHYRSNKHCIINNKNTDNPSSYKGNICTSINSKTSILRYDIEISTNLIYVSYEDLRLSFEIDKNDFAVRIMLPVSSMSDAMQFVSFEDLQLNGGSKPKTLSEGVLEEELTSSGAEEEEDSLDEYSDDKTPIELNMNNRSIISKTSLLLNTDKVHSDNDDNLTIEKPIED